MCIFHDMNHLWGHMIPSLTRITMLLPPSYIFSAIYCSFFIYIIRHTHQFITVNMKWLHPLVDMARKLGTPSEWDTYNGLSWGTEIVHSSFPRYRWVYLRFMDIHVVCGLSCFVVFWYKLICPNHSRMASMDYMDLDVRCPREAVKLDHSPPNPSGLLQWHLGNHMIAQVPMKQPWRMWFNSSPLEQNGSYFTDDMFKSVLVNEKFSILNQISLKFVPIGPNDNKSALVQLMAWCWTGDKPLTEWTDAGPVHWRIYASLGGDELINK